MADPIETTGSREPLPEYVVLQFAQPGGDTVPIGVLALEPRTDEMLIRMRDDWSGFPGHAIEVLADFPIDLEAKARECGSSALLAYLEDTLSNVILITDRRPVPGGQVSDAVVEALFQREVLSQLRGPELL